MATLRVWIRPALVALAVMATGCLDLDGYRMASDTGSDAAIGDAGPDSVTD